jgi:uncharacterized protein YbjT (DUF2867 family)
MHIAIFGATGMVGLGVLRECLIDPTVERVVTIGRTPVGATNPKLTDVVLPNLLDYSSVEPQLTGLDACFFCLGVSAAGMSEEAYRRVTYDITIAAAGTLSRLNPQMTFVYVSGMGTDSTERGRTMWARVKGQTENALLKMPFKAAFMFRPAIIQPLHGIRSKTTSYRVFYFVLAPLLPLLRRLFPRYITTTEQIGRAMLHVARTGAAKNILETIDINRL